MLSKPMQTFISKYSLFFYNNSRVYTWSRPISNYQSIFRKSFSGCVVTTQPVSIVREATLNLQKNLCLENHWKPIKSLWARQTFLERPQKPTCFSFSAKKKNSRKEEVWWIAKENTKLHLLWVGIGKSQTALHSKFKSMICIFKKFSREKSFLNFEADGTDTKQNINH